MCNLHSCGYSNLVYTCIYNVDPRPVLEDLVLVYSSGFTALTCKLSFQYYIVFKAYGEFPYTCTHVYVINFVECMYIHVCKYSFARIHEPLEVGRE